MTEQNQYGLSLKEQATFLWALCRDSDNPKTCPVNLMKDLSECPFESGCDAIEQWEWLPILAKRIPPETNR